jgi:hypothetical protein
VLIPQHGVPSNACILHCLTFYSVSQIHRKLALGILTGKTESFDIMHITDILDHVLLLCSSACKYETIIYLHCVRTHLVVVCQICLKQYSSYTTSYVDDIPGFQVINFIAPFH